MLDLNVKDLTVHLDDRGSLFEVIHDYDFIPQKFGQCYVIQNWEKGTVRAFHMHKKLWDYFTIVSGTAKFWFIDSASEEKQQIILTEGTPKVIVVPPHVYHGWQSLSHKTILLSIASEVYNKDNPDEVRIPWDTFGKELWEVQYK